MNIERKCPGCGQAVGLARRVSTVPRRHDIVLVGMVCGYCAYEWSAEISCPSLSHGATLGQSVAVAAHAIVKPL